MISSAFFATSVAAFDEAANQLALRLRYQLKIDVRSNKKASLKLLTEVEKLKKHERQQQQAPQHKCS